MNLELLQQTTRRQFLERASLGLGSLALAELGGGVRADAPVVPADNPLAPRPPHFPARAKRVIFLCMRGGPSHVDTFDHKPRLEADSGRSGRRPGTRLLGSKWRFAPHGPGGLWISALFPHLAQRAGDLCLVRSMQTDIPNHPQAFVKLHTGNFQFVRPSLGAWTLYGLGTLNVRASGEIPVHHGDTVHLTPDPSKIHRFDAEGRAI